jgi:hypothetical protein
MGNRITIFQSPNGILSKSKSNKYYWKTTNGITKVNVKTKILKSKDLYVGTLVHFYNPQSGIPPCSFTVDKDHCLKLNDNPDVKSLMARKDGKEEDSPIFYLRKLYNSNSITHYKITYNGDSFDIYIIDNIPEINKTY